MTAMGNKVARLCSARLNTAATTSQLAFIVHIFATSSAECGKMG
jgi:hypothetical protein